MPYDYLIVGAGFAGSVCARQLADAGKRVLIIDKRDHIGGNAYDYVDEESGARIHKFGPHIFHTNSDKVFEYLSGFTDWRPYEHRVKAFVKGKLVPFPVNLDTLEALGLSAADCQPDASIKHPKNAEEQCLQRVGRKLYEAFFEGYTTKMWGVRPDELDAAVTARIPVRWDSRDDRYFTDKHQAMPKAGYSALFANLLDHPNIEVALAMRGHVMMLAEYGVRVIWTGPVDEYFNCSLGPLPYRSLQFEHSRLPKGHGAARQCAAVINYPSSAFDHTRATDWRRFAGEEEGATVLTFERPCADGEPYYPMPTREAQALYKRYEEAARKEAKVTFLGRLGTYQYLNMDQVVAQALTVSARLLGSNPAR